MRKDEPPPSLKPIRVRSVWSSNVDSEFGLIRSIIDDYAFVAMDTEFPGVVNRPKVEVPQQSYPDANYKLLKSNVDILKLIQIGLTLSDASGNLPDLGTDHCYIWEFNFRDFDVTSDDHDPDSVELLRRQGIDFSKTRQYGIDSFQFVELLMGSGLVCNESVCWITFHSAYDFGYLLKILSGLKLPDFKDEFLTKLEPFFKSRVYDVKHLIRFCPNVYGGLDRVAETLGVRRLVGSSHQAGSDSLLTLHVFRKLQETYLSREKIVMCGRVLYGLEVS